VIGRVGAALFFFPGSMAFVPLLQSQSSGTPVISVTQRHLPGAVGVFLLVLGFLVDEFQRRSQIRTSANHAVNTDVSDQGQQGTAPLAGFVMAAKNVLESSGSFIFSGLLLGALPLWSTSVFIGGVAVVLLLLILFPYRLQVMLLGITAAAVALPQLVFLRLASRQQSLFHWGAITSNPAPTKLIGYIGLMFGAKWPVIIVALILASSFQRRFLLALCSLFLLTVYTGLSVKTSAGYDFLPVWVIVANLFAAYGLWRLWKLKKPTIVGPVTATALSAMIVVGGVIDLLPIRNSSYVEVNYERDDFVRWLNKNTKSNDVFLTDRFVSHPILLAGRKIFLGGPPGTVGSDLAKREPIYRQMYESKNPRRVFELLKQTHINYVAFDDGIRTGGSIKNQNEYLYVRYFQKFYEDKENRYRKLMIYKVPDSVPPNVANMDLSEPAVTCFEGGHGSGKGQFDNPHGLGVDSAGNIFVADTGNARIEKFSPNGTFVTSIATLDPNGVAIDHTGDIYVAEIDSEHRVLKLAPDGSSIAEWAPALYGPRKIAIGPDDSIYVVDSGRNRIVKFSPNGQVLASWGSEGSGDGQFSGLSSVAIDSANNRVYVADAMNGRIQVFDSDGKFLAKWSVPEWGQSHGYEDLAIDSQTGSLYASSAHVNSILVFDLQGNRVGTFTPTAPDKLEGPSALALSNDKLFVLNAASARVSVIDLHNR
jgi:sugar lactone lactonase YvrE